MGNEREKLLLDIQNPLNASIKTLIEGQVTAALNLFNYFLCIQTLIFLMCVVQVRIEKSNNEILTASINSTSATVVDGQVK